MQSHDGARGRLALIPAVINLPRTPSPARRRGTLWNRDNHRTMLQFLRRNRDGGGCPSLQQQRARRGGQRKRSVSFGVFGYLMRSDLSEAEMIRSRDDEAGGGDGNAWAPAATRVQRTSKQRGDIANWDSFTNARDTNWIWHRTTDDVDFDACFSKTQIHGSFWRARSAKEINLAGHVRFCSIRHPAELGRQGGFLVQVLDRCDR